MPLATTEFTKSAAFEQAKQALVRSYIQREVGEMMKEAKKRGKSKLPELSDEELDKRVKRRAKAMYDISRYKRKKGKKKMDKKAAIALVQLVKAACNKPSMKKTKRQKNWSNMIKTSSVAERLVKVAEILDRKSGNKRQLRKELRKIAAPLPIPFRPTA